MARAGKGKKQKKSAGAAANGSRRSRRRSNRAGKASGASRPARPAVKQLASGSPYTKLILDPCEAKLTSAPLPGRVGAQAMRIPFRAIITVPTSTTALSGASQTGGTPCSAVAASLFPHAMQSASGSYACPIIVQGLVSEGSAAGISSSTGGASFANLVAVYPSGLGQLFSISSEIRPIAACIKMGYIGPQGSNAGNFIAFEGQAAQFYAKYGSGSNPAGDASASMALAVPLSTLALDAWTTCDTTKTVEARVNFAAADPYWQNFRPTSTPAAASAPYVRGSGVFDSTCLADPDLTGVPAATVAVSGAVGGTQYLITGAIVYEWVPSVTLGIPAPQRSLRDPKQLQTVVAQLGKYGRMLVGLVSDASTGTAPGLMLDLAMKAFSSLAVGRMSNTRVPRIGM